MPESVPRSSQGSASDGSQLRSRGSARRRLLVAGAAFLAVAALVAGVVVVVPLSPVDSYLRGVISAQVSARAACQGRPRPVVEVSGRGLLRSLLADRLDEVRITLADVRVGGAEHARVETVVQHLSNLRAQAPTAGGLTTRVSITYDDLPAPQQGPAAAVSLAEDGRLSLKLPVPAEQAALTTSVLVLNLGFQGGNVVAVPQEFRLFGRTVPLGSVSALTGGPRVNKLPVLPRGLKYTDVSAEPDGIHVSLEGVVATPLTVLPRRVGGRSISYLASRGRLGLRTNENILGLLDIPITIWTRPRLAPGRLVLDPVSVDVLGENRAPDDPIARAVLSQTDSSTLGRTLPPLPAGVRYRFTSVDQEGIKVGVAGTTVRPFSALPNPTPGARTTYGAEDGRLTVTTTGTPEGREPAPLELLTRPRLDGEELVLSPEIVRLFGVDFVPENVFNATGGAPNTRFPLAPLADGLSYSRVEATSEGLSLTVTGRDLPLSSDLLGSDGCAPTAAKAG